MKPFARDRRPRARAHTPAATFAWIVSLLACLPSPSTIAGKPEGDATATAPPTRDALAARIDRAIPRNACFVERWYEDPGDDFLEPYRSRTREALRSSGIEKPAFDLLSLLLGDAADAAVPVPDLGAAEQALDLAPVVPVEGFVALVWEGERFEPVLAGRVADARAARRALEKALTMLGDRTGTELRKRGEAPGAPPSWSLELRGIPGAELHASLDRDFLVLAASGERMASLRGRLASDSSRASFDAPASRLEIARRRVPAPGSSLRFIDWKALLTGASATLQREVRSLENEDATSRRLPWLRIGAEVVDDLAFLETSIRVEDATPDRRLRRHVDTRLDATKAGGPLARLLLDRPNFESFHALCPYDTTNTDLNAGIDPVAAFDYVVALLGRHLPGGPSAVESGLARIDAAFGVELRNGLLAPFTGQNAVINRPGAGSKMFSTNSDDILMLFRLRDPAALASLLETWPDSALRRLAASGVGYIQPLDPLEIFEGSTFYGWNIPYIGDFRPMYGVHDDWFVFGMTPAAIQRAIEEIESDGPTLLQNPRFSSIGLVPYTDVRSFQFIDMGWDFQSGAVVLTQMGMTGTMFNMALRASPEGLENQRALEFLAVALDLLPPIASILQTLDYYGDRVDLRYHDRKRHALVRRTVTTIRTNEAERPEPR